ncbi:hypothetical protein HDU93_005450, partial [Gonapodya sp. JEL0774]
MYHEVKIGLTLRPASECYITSDGLPPASGVPSLTSCSLFIDYVFLDSDERKMFSSNAHEYLITQLQYNGGETVTTSTARIKLNFSHPTKEIVWVVQPTDNVSNNRNRWVDFSDAGSGTNPFAGGDTVAQAKIQVNNQDRISLRNSAYFSRIVPLFSHTRGPGTGIYTYSFALRPEDHAPSGTINLSRIESTTLFLNLTTGTRPVTVHVFAINYNVLRITSGLGGLAFASFLGLDRDSFGTGCIGGKDDFFWDSGASYHASHLLDNFESIVPSSSKLHLANGKTLAVHGVGTIRIRTGYSEVLLRDVLYVPDLAMQLVSSSALAKQGVSFTGIGADVEFFGADGNKILSAAADETTGLYK